MTAHIEISDEEVRSRIKQKQICFGGNAKLKIYGTLHCRSGKRMKKQNRVFFVSEKVAIHRGFRPCGQCLSNEYKKWKNGFIQHQRNNQPVTI